MRRLYALANVLIDHRTIRYKAAVPAGRGTRRPSLCGRRAGAAASCWGSDTLRKDTQPLRRRGFGCSSAVCSAHCILMGDSLIDAYAARNAFVMVQMRSPPGVQRGHTVRALVNRFGRRVIVTHLLAISVAPSCRVRRRGCALALSILRASVDVAPFGTSELQFEDNSAMSCRTCKRVCGVCCRRDGREKEEMEVGRC